MIDQQSVLFVLPPMSQMNTPYPSTAYLMGFLKKHGFKSRQKDLGLDLFYRLFTYSGLEKIRNILFEKSSASSRIIIPTLRHFILNFDQIAAAIDPVMAFVRGLEPTLYYRINNGTLLPKNGVSYGSIDHFEDYRQAVDRLSDYDRAMNIAGFFLQDIANVITFLDPEFQFNRYGEKLAGQSFSFDSLTERLSRQEFIDDFVEELIREAIEEAHPSLVAFSVPFPGNLYASLRMGRYVKRKFTQIKVVVGGGFCNTSLRHLSDARVFECIDYLTLDDGERPLLCLLEFLSGVRQKEELLRTFLLDEEHVRYVSSPKEKDVSHAELAPPTYEGLDLKRYFPQVFAGFNLNPFMSLYNNYHWNKLTIAHGCYWKKCTFCDTHLDYIGRYDPASVDVLLERIERVIEETGHHAFHFVDEACPPSTLFRLSQHLIKRGIKIIWFGNIRFDNAFTREVAQVLAMAGCAMVTGGLEVASDRILKLMDKGTTVEQVAKVAQAFTEAGILVHAYLIYGFPTQTVQEIIDSLELVRQFFKLGLLKSAAWHEFGATIHSPIGKDPKKFGIELIQADVAAAPHGVFSHYNVLYRGDGAFNFFPLGPGLRAAASAYMLGSGFDRDLRDWFDFEVPGPSVRRDSIRRLLSGQRSRKFVVAQSSKKTVLEVHACIT